MRPTVTPQEFVATFDGLVDKRQRDITDLWYAARDYTEIFLHPESGVLPKAASELGLSYWPGLLNIDACLYSGHQEPYVVSCAIEHENYAKSSIWEANKLALLSVPLRVLITYPHTPANDAPLLSLYGRIIERVDHPRTIGRAADFLAAFASKVGDGVNWRYYLFSDGTFRSTSVETVEAP